MRRLRETVLILAAVALAGCATSALKLAPDRPDRPWAPAVDETGAIVPGKQGQPSPGGYVLPPNPALAALPAAPEVDATHPYSLAELIDLAERNDPETRIAWDDARRAALAAGIAQSAYLPHITATALGGYETSSGRLNALDASQNSSGGAHGSVSAVSLQWLLFDFGERRAIVEAAREGSVISNIAFTAAHQQLIYAVTLAFYAHTAAQARLDTTAQSLSDAKAIQAAADDRLRHGVGTVVETAQARQAVAQAELAHVEAEGRAKDAYQALITAMGVSPLTKLTVARLSERALTPAMSKSVEAVISEALARRPDVQGAYAAERVARANVEAARAAFMPKVFVAGNAAYTSGGLGLTALPGMGQEAPTLNITGNRLSGLVVGGVTVPLYDGGMRAASLAQARAQADSAGEQFERARQDAVREIVQADNALRTSLSTYAAAEALSDAAQTTFDAAMGAYRNGVGSVTDVIAAERGLLEAKTTRTDAYVASLGAAATIALSTGLLGQAPA